MTPKNPFADPEHPIDYGICGKDVPNEVEKPQNKPESKPFLEGLIGKVKLDLEKMKYFKHLDYFESCLSKIIIDTKEKFNITKTSNLEITELYKNISLNNKLR